MKKEQPKLSGVVQTMGKTRKVLGRLVLWENHSANPRAPILRGVLSTNNGKSEVVLWPFVPRPKKEPCLDG